MGRSIVLAEDHEVVREGFKLLLAQDAALEVVGEAGDGLTAVEAVERTRPDLAILDLSMPALDGAEAILRIRKTSPGTRILVLTAHASGALLDQALNAGVEGVLLKEEGAGRLMEAVRAVLDGRGYLSPRIRDRLEGPAPNHLRLTPREREVLRHIVAGLTNKEIARQLGISFKTVNNHRENLMRKLDVHSAADLVAYAFREGLVAQAER